MLVVDYFEGKDTEIFNHFVKSNFADVISIVHDTEAREVRVEGRLNDAEKLEISSFYTGLPIISPIEKAKKVLSVRVNNHRDELATATFEHEIDGVVYTFDCNDRSAIRLTALVTGATYHRSAGLEFSQVWRTSDNQNILLSADEAIALFASAREHESAVVFKAVHIKELIENADYASVEEIENINAVQLWESTPWPLI